MTRPFLPYGRQLVDEDDIAAVVGVLRGDWLTTGPKVSEFEAALAGRVDAGFAVACSSGTAALHLAASVLGLGPDDSAVVPSMTFVATANAARYVGAGVVLADVDPDTGLMETEHVEAAISEAGGDRVKAVFPVHLNGQSPDMRSLADMSRKRDVRLVEDACHALGTKCRASTGEFAPVGNCRDADLAVFSFHPVKTATMGEGGAVMTDDETLAAALRSLRNHGIVRDPEEFVDEALAFDGTGAANPWYYEIGETGFNYRATDIQCALGLSQLGKLDGFIAKRKELAARYDELLGGAGDAVRPVARSRDCDPAWHLYVVLCDFEGLNVERSAVMYRLAERGIGTQVHYVPLHLQRPFRSDGHVRRFPGAEAYYRRALSLPLFPAMEPGDVDRVVGELFAAVGLE